jgi:hypothetical protein
MRQGAVTRNTARVPPPELTLLADAARVLAEVPVEERVGLRDDIVAFLREELDLERRGDIA